MSVLQYVDYAIFSTTREDGFKSYWARNLGVVIQVLSEYVDLAGYMFRFRFIKSP